MAREFKPRARTSRSRKTKFREVLKCRFCRDKTEMIDYKDLHILQKLVTSQGKVYSRKRSGNCAKHQRQVCQAIKRARFLGLMPYVG
jgi:small subunit ribosomal protein S18